MSMVLTRSAQPGRHEGSGAGPSGQRPGALTARPLGQLLISVYIQALMLPLTCRILLGSRYIIKFILYGKFIIIHSEPPWAVLRPFGALFGGCFWPFGPLFRSFRLRPLFRSFNLKYMYTYIYIFI